MGFRAVYSHLVFTLTSLTLENSEDPIPKWPIKHPENLYDLSNTASDGSFYYFSNLTTGQFICLIHTAKNFEIYNLKVKKGSSSFDKRIDIATVWLSHFTKTALNRKAIWALFNRRQNKFKELQMFFNARNDTKVKEKLISFLNDKLVLPEKKKESFQNEITKARTDTSSTYEKENKTSEVEQKLHSVNKLLKSTKKKVQRRNQNISGLKSKLHEAYEKFETDTKSIKLYYNGIVENLKMQKMKIEEMKNLETQSGGKYKGEVRLLYYDLLTKGVSANTIQSVVRTVLENMTEYDTTKLKLPSRPTAQRMVSEAGELVKIRTAYELSKEKTMLCHQSDGTTKNRIHWGAHAVKLLPNDDPNNPKLFT
ncbi:unnamed protein product [Mytilus coruscus]|uniref:Uncharacterized protein n=1 Tax=Mytilus coruscus TaxID=42192 RepID=A0A6J8C170_MYTCO|nr:unnamed protein product [Mytilus coruscus]